MYKTTSYKLQGAHVGKIIGYSSLVIFCEKYLKLKYFSHQRR